MGDGHVVDLKAFTEEQLAAFFKTLKEPAFRAKQFLLRVYTKKAVSIDEITEFSLPLREHLKGISFISGLRIVNRLVSNDGTRKYLFALGDGLTIESVLIEDGERLTLCVSSQVGCAMGCKFCLTARGGFKRNLKAHEICDQILCVSRDIEPQRRITNIVMMGMGEPLSNYKEVTGALKIMMEWLNISKRHITLSTAGLVPELERLYCDGFNVNPAISLNATTDDIRSMIMPVNKRYNLKTLLSACRRLPIPERRRITFEYVLLKGVNDSVDDASRLIRLLKGIRAKVNLIPFNEYEGAYFKRPDDTTVLEFQEIVAHGHISVFIRKSKGRDILAACGQLRASN
ncbi:MAG: 23S rRNA (adenine(2503)-C(2))-methyltransferase RlmN [Nitrospirae bacterium]|nr:23S rRNA (adenine(2503)-C(2))-methyltransferase RlmN [Nitrospirota bacterium]MBF0534725.1 23S rRNA (adenine(2503)-C(2))-methyltransferase RlmN [Nitrospirota bacterium]MBF0616399.1 23S rRNA (adenine(2503)-C(2))-methyltransferase RlmN [Nitrospirota bacterium]